MKKLALLFAFVFILTQTAVIHAATEQEMMNWIWPDGLLESVRKKRM